MNKQAILLLNMGGSNNIDEIQIFLENMFSDKNILPMNIYLRKILSYIIIQNRIEAVKEDYRKIGGKSPLGEITQKLIEKIKQKINIPIFQAMRYTPIFAIDSLKKCKKEEIKEIILFSMYPHFSSTTTLSSIENIQDGCKKLNYFPKIKIIKSYYDDLDYIRIISKKILEAMQGKNTEEYDLILSAHSLPLSIIKNGDLYEKHIESNISSLKLYFQIKNIKFKEIKLAYQSKVGKSAWLQPNIVDILRNPTNNKVIVYPLSFTIDNFETIFELNIDYREIVSKIGYKDFIVSKVLNDDNDFVDFIISKIKL